VLNEPETTPGPPTGRKMRKKNRNWSGVVKEPGGKIPVEPEERGNRRGEGPKRNGARLIVGAAMQNQSEGGGQKNKGRNGRG